MGRGDNTMAAAPEQRINYRRHHDDDDVQGPKGQAKAKGSNLKSKVKDNAYAAKEAVKSKAYDATEMVHDAKGAAKAKGREAQGAAQNWFETAKDKAFHMRDVFMGKTRYVRSGVHDVADDAKDVLRRSAHEARFVAAKAVHPSLSAKAAFVTIALGIVLIALLAGISKRRHLSTFQRAKEAVFGRPSMVEEAKDLASDAFKTVKGTTDKVFDAAHYAKVKGENAVKKGVDIGEDAADVAGGMLHASGKVASKLATGAYEYVMGKADEAKDAASEAIHKLAKDARV
jgi:hypothetical protein